VGISIGSAGEGPNGRFQDINSTDSHAIDDPGDVLVKERLDITQLLVAWSEGDEIALQQLIPLVYEDLHRRAERYMRRERPGHPLETTGLVHEAYLRLIDYKRMQWHNRAHFYSVASQLMRRILVEFARATNSVKRGGEFRRVSLTEAAGVYQKPVDLLALDDALTALNALDPRQSKVVELRFFGGLTLEEVAEVLKVSVGTVRRDWSLAQAWLYSTLNEGQ
jgi:RNA polymerase sigma factor (TIGR02999 family)